MESHATTGPTGYQELAQAYVDGVQALLAPSGSLSGERGAAGPASYDQLAEQAAALAPVSDQLTRRAAGLLEAPETDARSHGEIRLLAKAQSDLEVSTYLLQAALDEQDAVGWQQVVGAERGESGRRAIDASLNLLLSDLGVPVQPTERGVTPPPDLPNAQITLTMTVEDTLALVSERASRTGQAALTGLFSLGLAEVAQAAAVVGMDIASSLGRVEQASRLVELFRGFLVNSYDALVALLGPGLAQTAANQVVEMVKSVQEGEQFGKLLERLYQTGLIQEELTQVIQQSQATLADFGRAIDRVAGLESGHRQKVGQVDGLIKKLKFVGALPVAVLPQGRLLLSAAYIVLGGYVVLAGADYVDARALRLFNRVTGVREVVLTSLRAGKE